MGAVRQCLAAVALGFVQRKHRLRVPLRIHQFAGCFRSTESRVMSLKQEIGVIQASCHIKQLID